MADLTFASYLQGPLGEAIRETDNMSLLPPPGFSPAISLTTTLPHVDAGSVKGPDMRLLGPGDVAGLAPGTVIRTDPPPSALDVEGNYLAVAEVVPAELPWVLTPAKAAAGRLRPWFVLVVLEAATAPVRPGKPLPTIEAEIAQLPDLRDSWGWAHVQRSTGAGELPGGGQASAATLARLVCPRRLSKPTTYRACLVPAFRSGVAAGLGDPKASEIPNDLAWKVEDAGTVLLPVYHEWTFTVGHSGDFETLVGRLQPADTDALRVASVRPVDVRAPWPGDEALSPDTQLVGVQGALVPFEAPPAPEPPVSADVLAAIDERLRAQLDAPARRLLEVTDDDTTGTLAPPLYGGRHVNQDLVEGDPAWLAQLNTSITNRIAAGLGAEYVRVNQEDLMAKAWQQVGAIREANRLRAVVELTSEVAAIMHDRHVASLAPGELLAFAAPASARTRTSQATTLAMETRMSRMTDGTATSAFARRVRPAAKLAKRTGVSVRSIIPRALSGEVAVPAAAPVIPAAPSVAASGVVDVSSAVAATQLMTITAMARVAELNNAAAGGAALMARIQTLQLDDDVTTSMEIGRFDGLATAIAGQVSAVAETTTQMLADMTTNAAEFGSLSRFGVPIADADIAGRITVALHPGDSHRSRLASRMVLPSRLTPAGPNDPVMTCPDFPVPLALALLDSDPEWFLPGLGALPMNNVALMRQNGAFIESYLAGMNHEMMRELLWREYPTDRRGTPFKRFWPRPDGSADIPPINTWSGPDALGKHLQQADALSVLLVRGDVIRRFPDVIVTAIPSGAPDAAGHHRPDPAQQPRPPIFVIRVDEATSAYAFNIPDVELTTPATAHAPGWFFVFAEHGFRIRFGFDEPEKPTSLDTWNNAGWPTDLVPSGPATVPMARGHAVAGAEFTPVPNLVEGQPKWNRDAADIARITLQRPVRVAIQAEILVHSKDPG